MTTSTTERGYGWPHQQQRAQWTPVVARGQVVCRRASNGTCLELNVYIDPTEPWQLGHPDETCAAPLAPEHRICNASTRRTDRQQARRTPPTSRQSRRW